VGGMSWSPCQIVGGSKGIGVGVGDGMVVDWKSVAMGG